MPGTALRSQRRVRLPRCRIGEGQVREATEGLDRPVYYICGKSSMMGATLSLLSNFGVPEGGIMVEVFRGYRG
jgi:ferredoxin-NADP reductase